jgi:TPP-dependent pyruvate/acetoin dehydrogenase alpha subunit
VSHEQARPPGVGRLAASKSRRGAPSAGGAERELDLSLYRRMVLIRCFEEAVQRLFLSGEVHGTTHLYSGQEASAVGICSMLADGDRVAATYRGHGAALALGGSPQGLMDELCGRASGVCGGRAGSMNVVDLEHGLVGCFSIVGGSIGAATGVALAFKKRRLPNVAVAFFGDGAMNQGYLHECLNFAAVERLPLVLVCENNLYMEFTPIETVTAGEIVERARVFGVPASSHDGNDVWAVRGVAAQALEHARSGAGPVFLELLTYRLVGHSRSDPGRYRKPGELESWRERDPLVIARGELAARHAITAKQIDALDQEVAAEIALVGERALAAAWPDPKLPLSEFAP